MAVNKYGNDFKNNIMWNKEYPFIPEVTNDAGLTIHEGDILNYLGYKPGTPKRLWYSARVMKIYDKNIIWIRIRSMPNKPNPANTVIPAERLFPHTADAVPPCMEEDFDNQDIYNALEFFLCKAYVRKYPTELNLPNDDWHFDSEKYEAKRLEEVAMLKKKY